MKNLVREKILSGGNVVGTFFELGGMTAVECLGLSGLDFFIIDTEHGPFDVESAGGFVIAAGQRGIIPFARVKDSTRPSILKMLDIGAKGLIIPCLRSVEEAKRLVEFGKYYPLGLRGVAHSRSTGFGFEPFASDLVSYFEIANRETLIIPQCETRECLENIEEIAAIEGIDGIFVGPYDLSVALGKPAQIDAPEMTSAIARILAACKTFGKFSFIYVGGVDAARRYLTDGFDGVAYAMDSMIYVEAYQKIIKEIRSQG
ncbi:MAG: 4-hydroxy-2-oxovalerate aldolase [Synergistaceae bacterium]|nr:4-hydroxy-2-oxovalerate aldolase [Synergistaceae bacterium]